MFDGWKNLIWMTYPVMMAILLCFSFLLGLPDDASDAYLRNTMLKNYNLTVSDVPRFTFTVFSDDFSIRWNNLSFLVSCIIVISFHYSVIVFCGVRMHLNMKYELKKFSITNQELQRQLFRALVFQSLGPTLFLFLPIFPMVSWPLLVPFLEIEIDWQTGWCYLLIGLYSPFDSIAFMLIVSEYREWFKKKINWAVSRHTQVATMENVSTAVQPNIETISYPQN